MALLESSLDCVIVMDGEGRVVDLNRETETTFGFARAAVVGRRLGDVFVPSELRAAHERGLHRYLATGESRILGSRVEVQALHANGRRVMVELSIVRLRDVEPPLFVGHLRNIEEQKRKERRLRVSAAASRALAARADAEGVAHDLLRALGEELEWPVAQFWTMAPDRDALQLSASWRAPSEAADALAEVQTLQRGIGMPGRAWDTNVALWIEDLRSETNLPRLPQLLDAGFASAVCVPVHVHGEVVAVIEAFSRNVQSPDPQLLLLLEAIGGQLGYFIEEQAMRRALAASEAALRDLAEREQEARLAAERANRAKDDFLAIVSHELRTPLGTIVGWARMLQSGRLDSETAAKALDAIARNAELQARVVDDLLDMSRIVAGKLTLTKETVDVPPIVQAVVGAMRAAAGAKSLTLDYHAEGDVPMVTADPARLQQIVMNLVSNSIKFTPPGGRVMVSVAAKPPGVEIAVADTGLGLDAETVAEVFEPFWQGRDAQAAASSGLGLGLSIVRDLVQAHGGRVTASSDGRGRGATFTVILPAYTPQI